MLYNSKWQKPEVLSLRGLVTWLREQPPETKYDFGSIRTCLIANYLSAATGEVFPASKYFLSDVTGPPDYSRVAATKPWTYGAALKRAEEVLNERIKTAT